MKKKIFTKIKMFSSLPGKSKRRKSSQKCLKELDPNLLIDNINFPNGQLKSFSCFQKKKNRINRYR